MILDYTGKPIRSPHTNGRRGSQIDGFSLPNGAVISAKKTMELHDKIKNNAELRERIAIADRMTGTESIHLAMLRRTDKTTGMTNQIEKSLIKNLEFGEKVQRKRVRDEKLTESARGYEKAS